MTLGRFVTASLLGALTLSPGVLGARPGRALKQDFPTHFPDGTPIPDAYDYIPPDHKPDGKDDGKDGHAPTINVSSASCVAYANGYSEVNDKDSIAYVSAEAKQYICGEGKSEAVIAEATAKAFAKAVAYAFGKCHQVGHTDVLVKAHAEAEAKALVWLKAYAEAFAHVDGCGLCEAWASSWAKIEKDVFLHAVAEAHIKIDSTTKGEELHIKAKDYEKDVHKVVATAFAKALADAKDYYGKNKCIAWVETEACIDDHCVECKAVALSESQVIEIDAIAVAYAEADAAVCGAQKALAYADLEVTAKATAFALAQAYSLAFAACKSEKGGYACAQADTEIKATAEAVAVAIAAGWAEASTCKTLCKADGLAIALGKVLVEVATDAWAGVCVAGKDYWVDEDWEYAIDYDHLVAIAKAYALAIAHTDPDSQSCLAVVGVGAFVV